MADIPWSQRRRSDGFTPEQREDIKKTFSGKMTKELSPAEKFREKTLGFFGVKDAEAEARREAIKKQK